MKVLIVAQNLFIARLLISIAEGLKSVDEYKVIVFSSLEKFILLRFHEIPEEKIICPSQIKKNELIKIYEESIELKRGTYSKETVKMLQRSLLSMLNLNEAYRYQHVWIFNEFTFIGRCLRAYEKYASKCIIFENSNKNGGVTILGDLKGKNGEHLRRKLLNSNNYSTNLLKSKIQFPKIYRMVTLPFHFRSVKGCAYYLKRLSSRLSNILIFHIYNWVKKPPKVYNNSDPIALIALQIKDDSAIAMNINFSDYCHSLIDKVLEIKSANQGLLILVRPHPLDYTFGWLTVYRMMRGRLKNVHLDFSKSYKFNGIKFDFLVTYNSNIVRDPIFKRSDIKVYKTSKSVLLPNFDKPLDQLFEGTFK